jgi:hypothetical protein
LISHPLNLRAQPLTVADPALAVDFGETHPDEGPDFGRELAAPAAACQRLDQLLRIAALQGSPPTLHGFAIHLEVPLRSQALHPGVVEPGHQQLIGRMLPILRHHFQQLGAIIHMQRRRGASLATHTEDRIALVGAQYGL